MSIEINRMTDKQTKRDRDRRMYTDRETDRQTKRDRDRDRRMYTDRETDRQRDRPAGMVGSQV